MEVIKLNLIPAGALPVVHASQYDDGRDFKAELYEGVNVYTLDGTETLTAIVKKPDGNEVTAAVSNTSDNYVIITTTEQMTACAGGNLGTLRIEKGAVTIATLNFILECQVSPDTGIQSDSEIHNFEAQVNQMVEDALASQYDSANVIFDNLPTAGHGIPYTVTSEGIGNAIDAAFDMTAEASGAIATFESEYALPLRDLEIEINAVQESGTPTPSSPKAISGFTGANIGYCDFNQLVKNGNFASNTNWGTIDSSYTQIAISNNVLTMTILQTAGESWRYGVQQSNIFSDSSHKYLFVGNVKGSRSCSFKIELGGQAKAVIPITANTKTLISFINTASTYNKTLLMYPIGENISANDTFELTNIMVVDLTQMFGTTIADYIYSLEQSTTGAGVAWFRNLFPKSYYAYNAGGTKVSIESINGSPYPNAQVSWQTEAGTVYGGSLDVTSGVLKVTWGSVDLGSLSWDYTAQGYGRSSTAITNPKLPASESATANIICECLVANSANQVYSHNEGVAVDSASKVRVYWSTMPTTGADIKSALNGQLLVYELATPVTYQLTPTQISAIVGTNNVFTDTNGDTSLEYYAGHGEETAQVAEEIASVVVADYAAKVVKTKNGIFANLLKSPLNSVWLICCQKVTTAGSGFVGIYSFDGVNLSPCVVYIDGMSASFNSATGTITVKYGGSTTDVYGSAFRLA